MKNDLLVLEKILDEFFLKGNQEEILQLLDEKFNEYGEAVRKSKDPEDLD